MSLFLQSAEANTWYVSTKGSDSYSGTSEERTNDSGPFATLQRAVDVAKPGDEILIASGTYYDQVTIKDKRNITIRPLGDGKVILSNLQKEYIDNENYPWTLIRKEKGKYVYVSNITNQAKKVNERLPDWYPQFNHIFLANHEQLYHYRNWEEYRSKSNVRNRGEGYIITKDSIYAVVDDPYDPKYQSMYVTKSGFMIRIINSRNINIGGNDDNHIRIKYGGRYGIGVSGEASGLYLHHITFDMCRHGLYLNNVSGNKAIIEHCVFRYHVSDQYIWQDVKGSMLESNGISYAQGSLNIEIRNSLFDGVFNGAMTLAGQADIHHNTFVNIGDDAVELDGPAIDTKVHDNYFIDCFTAFSLCPVEQGPVYIYNNLITNSKSEFPFEILKKTGKLRSVAPKTFKFTNHPKNGKETKNGRKVRISKNVHAYYNTVISTTSPFDIGSYSRRELSPVHSSFYNNIFYSENTLTLSTGFVTDGIDIKSNIWYSKYGDKKGKVFRGWNGNNAYRTLPKSKDWTGNIETRIQFEMKEIDFDLRAPQVCNMKDIMKKWVTRKIDNTWPDAENLNKRNFPGYISD